MTTLPEPPAATAGQADRNTVINQRADQLLAAINGITPTQHPDARPLATIGDAAPVPQPDSRIVPRWALGLAVGSIGVGAGSVGLGCAIWLACKGLSSVIHSLSSVTLAGVLTVAAPFAGAAMLATAIGGAISKAKKAALPDVHVHNGPEYHETSVDKRRAVFQKDVIKSRR